MTQALVWLTNELGACNLVTEEAALERIEGNGNLPDEFTNEHGYAVVDDEEAAVMLGRELELVIAAREEAEALLEPKLEPAVEREPEPEPEPEPELEQPAEAEPETPAEAPAETKPAGRTRKPRA
jgi:hypothetical protein